MECKEAQEQLAPYLLGALDSQEMSAMDSHLQTCAECSLILNQEGDIVTELAYAVPQLEAPPGVRQRLFSRIEMEEVRSRPAEVGREWFDFLPRLGWRLATHSGMAVASVLAVVVVFGGVWFNSRLDNLAEERDAVAAEVETVNDGGAQVTGRVEALATQIATVAASDADMIEKVDAISTKLETMAKDEARTLQELRYQREMSYMAASPGVTVNMLTGTQSGTGARGIVLAPPTVGRPALLSVFALPPLPADEAYRVWLIKGNQTFDAGYFTVDETGYGYAVINLIAPLAWYEAVVITVEGVDGSPDPMADRVLKGDL